MRYLILFAVCLPTYVSTMEKAPEKPKKDIFQAIKRGDLSVVGSLLIEDSSLINTKDEHGNKPIHAAINTGNEELIRYFISIDPFWHEKRDNEGNTPLHTAAEIGKANIVQLILRLQMPLLNIQNNTEKTPLMLAVQKNNITVVKELLENHALKNLHDSNNDTALIIAVKTANIDMVQLLLGGPTDMAGRFEAHALEVACNYLTHELKESDAYKMKYEQNHDPENNKKHLEHLQKAQRYNRIFREFFRKRGSQEYKKYMTTCYNRMRSHRLHAERQSRASLAKSFDSVLESLQDFVK